MMEQRVTPVDLDTHPEVERMLVAAGLGRLRRETVTAPIGRNTSWAGTTDTGVPVFVKRLRAGDCAARFDRSVAFHRFLEAHAGGLQAPSLLAADGEHHLLAFELVVDAETGGDLMVAEQFTLDHARQVGEMIGSLHAGAVPDGVELDQTPPPLPPLGFFEGLSLGSFLESSAAELEAWRLLQADRPLTDALHRLRAQEQAAPRVPSHADFRVDQLLFRDDRVLLADWEEFRLADPARDVGAFAGEWIFRSMLDVVTDRGDDRFVDLEFTHAAVVQRGAEKLERLLPLVHAFWEGYRSWRSQVDAGFAARATAFAGWHLLDRLVAGAASTHRLSGIQRGAAGVGRRAVLDPERFSFVLGLGAAA